ncbi:hypothetical protein GCM10010503_63970 [Streptomyces lucensis JCM 4490]|uniref:Uncharacterized protein n=1 Tax=Streptomyces lucensis JCM 4490 TaxID=1306176 RepID=A0A918JG34_9ACTN|nr:hypothetical protein [Streptomyces lucensis]GGW77282.1 hypothetical protein GCM10010503_63970 [Streptomyces lucensis JCM 4490]
MAHGVGVAGAARAAVTDGAGARRGRPGDAFEQLGAVADAVLYEGYLLYPYRRSSPKNRVRWQFGVLLPRDWVERDGPVTPGISGSADSWYQQTECLLRVRRDDAAVRVRVRYLQVQDKQVEAADGEGRHRPVGSLRTADGVTHLSFEEAVPRESELVLPLSELLRGAGRVTARAPAGTDHEALPSGVGRTVRRRRELRAVTSVLAEPLTPGLYRLRVRTENRGEAQDVRAPRGEALRDALIATHTLVGGDGVEFVSLIDPPAAHAEHVRDCRNEFTFPVLGGAPPQSGAAARAQGATGGLMLSAPIILPDHPQVAPESPGDLHDAAEIDEILTLRTMLLTDEEKAEARATDARAARILDRVDTMPPEVFARLHGTIRSLAPAGVPVPARTEVPERPAWWQEGGDDGLSPTGDTVLVGGTPVGRGTRVMLRPRARGADAQDMFLDGRTARVAAVFHDVDGSVHLAVTVDDDPAAELHGWYGRFHYFRPDEVEALAGPDTAGPAHPARPRAPRPARPADRPEEGRPDGRP